MKAIDLTVHAGGTSARLLEAERLQTIARAESEYQLRLPIHPLPHCACQPRSLARAFVRADASQEPA